MKWEYKTIISAGGFIGGKIDGEKFTAHLNELGQDGWEMVSVFDTNQSGGQTRDVFAFFNRPM